MTNRFRENIKSLLKNRRSDIAEGEHYVGDISKKTSVLMVV